MFHTQGQDRARRLALALAVTVAAAIWPALGCADEVAESLPDAGAGATLVIEEFHDSLIDLMKRSDELSFDERVAILRPVMGETFDLDFMSAKSVGRGWKALSPDEQRLWVDRFSELTICNYAGRFVGHEGEHFETLGTESAARETLMVMTRLHVPTGEDVRLDYRLRSTQRGWRVIDIYMKGTVSELALRRSEYAPTLKRDGFGKLASAIDDKIEELREDSDG